MTTIPSSFDWVPEIKPDLKQLDSIPLTGATPPFPWEDFSARLAHSFDRKELRIQPGEMRWRTGDSLYEGLGDTPFPLTFSIPSLNGTVTWVIPTQEMPILSTLLLTQESHPIQDQTLNESFYQFLALEVLYQLSQVSFAPSLSPILNKQANLPNEDSLCWDISLMIQNHTLLGRLIISPTFRHSWVNHFAKKQGTSFLSQQMTQHVNVTVHLEMGKTQLTLAEWMSVQLGDFIILDSCSLDPERLDGRIMLTINGKPTFRAKLKDGTLKILELPLLHEVETPMAKQPDDEDDLSDLDFPEENEDEFEDEDFLSETEDDLFTDEDGELEEIATETESLPESTEEEITETPPTPSITTARPIVPEEIPITVIVEIGQVEMSMDQLLKLEPGNLLELNLQPKDGVNLTVNGKIVGKGELIRIGETLGVRVLELGR